VIVVKVSSKSDSKRYVETVLCVSGGVIGLLSAVIQESAANSAQIAADGASPVDGRALGLMVACIFAICLPFFINDSRNYTAGGILFCGLMAIICGGMFGLIAGTLIIAAGIVAYCRP
jgi:hypothetical protein